MFEYKINTIDSSSGLILGPILPRDGPQYWAERICKSSRFISPEHMASAAILHSTAQLRRPLDRQGCLLARCSVVGLVPTTRLLSNSIPTEVIDRSPPLLGGLDWLGHAVSGDLDLTPRDCLFGAGNREAARATCSSAELFGRADRVGFF